MADPTNQSSREQEREAFEAQISNDGFPKRLLNRRDMAGSKHFGEYCDHSIQIAWESWQARACLAEQRTRAMRELLREWQQAYNGMDRGDGILTADFQSLRRRTHEALYQPRACKPQSSTELPGIWEQADLSGGATDCPPSAPAQSGEEGNG